MRDWRLGRRADDGLRGCSRTIGWSFGCLHGLEMWDLLHGVTCTTKQSKVQGLVHACMKNRLQSFTRIWKDGSLGI